MRLFKDLHPLNTLNSIMQRTGWRFLRSSRKLRGCKSSDVARSSDTLYVLGCAASINQLSQAQWDAIRASDSIGMNFWVLSDFAPTFYLLEGFLDQREKDFFLEQLEARKERFTKVTWLLQTREYLRYVKQPFRFLSALQERVGKRWYWLRYFKTNLEKDRRRQRFGAGVHSSLLKGSGSPTIALSFAYAMGYKKVVFCGVDLDASAYFWHREDHPQRDFRAKRESAGSFTPHKSSVGKRFSATQDFVRLFMQHFGERAGMQAYVAVKTGMLSEFLPLEPDHTA